METTLETLSNDDLELEMCSLQSRLAAATCHFLLSVAEYDRRRAWEAWECHDMAGWLSWKCAISPVTAREQVRVGHALGELALVRSEFEAGRLSYSQVRAISRVSTEATEAALVELAQVCTAAQLERVTRAYRRATQASAQTEAKRDRGRQLRYHWDDDGNLVGQFRLPAEAGAALLGALAAVQDRAAVDEADREGATDPAGAVRADALVQLVTAGHHAITAGATSDDDSGYLVTIITESAALQPQPADPRPAAGDPDTGAAKRDAAAGDGQADTSAAGRDATGGDGQGLTCQVADGPGIATETARRLACDATIIAITETPDGTPLNVGRRTRKINRALRRALTHRDQRRCQFPGCDRTRTQAHHIQHWTDGGPTNLANLISLCARHHHRLHEGRYTITTAHDGTIAFHRPDGTRYTPPAPATTRPTRAAYDPDDFYNHTDPYHSNWDGTPARTGDIIDGLLQAEDHWTAAHLDSAETNAVGAVA